MLYENPWLTFTNAPTDSNYMGQEAELAALHLRTEALYNALKNYQEFDVLLDMLDEHGQDPCKYLDEVEENLELVVVSHLVPEDLFYCRPGLV